MSDIHRLQPQAPDAERGLLGSFLLSPMEVGNFCAERNISGEHFYGPHHGVLYVMLKDLWTAGKAIDLITLTQAMRDAGTLELAGGAPYLSELYTFLPTATYAVQYADILENKRILREIIKTGAEYVSRGHDEQEDPSGLLAGAIEKLCAVAGTRSIAKPKTPLEIALEANDRATDRVEKRGLPDNVLLTGLPKLDESMSGIRPADYVLISGKEKSGKTSLAFNIFENVVFHQNKRAAVMSLEMKIPEITDRLIASMGRISLTNLLNGWMTEEESNKFVTSTNRIATGKFQFRDDIFSLGQIVAAFRQVKSQHADLELGIVDYLQLIDGEKTKEDKREQAIAHMSRTLRRLASELNIAMIVLVQLNEDGQVRESRSPGMDCTAHIRIEPGDEEGSKWARIVYQRNGPSNVGIPLTHIGRFLRFEAAADRGEAPAPKSKRKWND